MEQWREQDRAADAEQARDPPDEHTQGQHAERGDLVAVDQEVHLDVIHLDVIIDRRLFVLDDLLSVGLHGAALLSPTEGVVHAKPPDPPEGGVPLPANRTLRQAS